MDAEHTRATFAHFFADFLTTYPDIPLQVTGLTLKAESSQVPHHAFLIEIG